VRCKLSYLCASVFMVAMLLISAAPVWAQGYYGPYNYCVWSVYACEDYSGPASGAEGSSSLTYGPNGPYYGPYDYCAWSPYACQYY
jgi:hypothetical protein